MTSKRFVMGIDAGGTKTSCVIAAIPATSGPGDLEPCATSETGPGNLRSVGAEVAMANIRAAIEQALVSSRIGQADIAAICLAAAGAGREVEKKQLERGLSQLGYRNLMVCSDADILLPAVSVLTGQEHSTGIALIAGTGSIAIGCSPGAKGLRAGGWGYLLGDEGSGFAIGRAALMHYTRVVDLVDAPSQLSEMLPKQINVSALAEIVPWCYSGGNAREKVAGLAPMVFDSAAANCDVAQQIIEENATKLARTCVAVLRQAKDRDVPVTETDGTLTLACSGSLLTRRPDYCVTVTKLIACDTFVMQNVREVRPHTIVSPVDGAVELARRASGLR